MRVAVLIVGHIRNSLETDDLKNFLNMLRQHFNVCDIYMHTFDTYEALTKNPLHNAYDANLQNKTVKYNLIRDYINPTALCIEHQNIEMLTGNLEGKFRFGTPFIAMKYLYYSLLKAYTMSEESGIEYDIVMRIRPDIYKFPYLTNMNNLNATLKTIKYFKNKKNYVTGLLHFPGSPLSDNFYFMNHKDGKKFFHAMFNDYDEMCKFYKTLFVPEKIMAICIFKLKMTKHILPTFGGIADSYMFLKKNNTIKISFNNINK